MPRASVVPLAVLVQRVHLHPAPGVSHPAARSAATPGARTGWRRWGPRGWGRKAAAGAPQGHARRALLAPLQRSHGILILGGAGGRCAGGGRGAARSCPGTAAQKAGSRRRPRRGGGWGEPGGGPRGPGVAGRPGAELGAIVRGPPGPAAPRWPPAGRSRRGSGRQRGAPRSRPPAPAPAPARRRSARGLRALPG